MSTQQQPQQQPLDHQQQPQQQQPLDHQQEQHQQQQQQLQIHSTRNRASSWSLFRRNSIPAEPANSPPLSGPPAISTDTHTHPSTGSAPFSLSSLASALKRPLNLTTSPSPSPLTLAHPSPQQPHSPSDSKSTHELSARDADPDPTPSVPPRLVVESPSQESPPPVPFDFNLFLDQMRWPQAEPIAKYLRSFLKEFTKRATHPTKTTGVTEQIKVVNDFLDFISVKMREIPDGPWDPRTCNDSEFDNAVEAMEKLVMNRIWHLTFTPAIASTKPSQTDDLERDTVLSQKMNLFSWLTDRHLDLCLPPDEADGFLEFAKTELLKINSYKAPRDKMICILNCCKVIFGLIRHIDNSEGGADTFIPILILVVLRAQPKTLISNLQYIQRFRNPDKMQGENGYYMSSLNAAISFIERLEHSVLSNITQDEFEFNVEQAIVQLPRSPVQDTNTKASIGKKEGERTAGGGEMESEMERREGMGTSTSLPDLTRSWLFNTVPQLAEKAVSKPLNAIARIVDDLASSTSEPEDQERQPTDRQGLRRASSSTDALSVDPERRGSRRRGGRPWSADSARSSSHPSLPPSSSASLHPSSGSEKLKPHPTDRPSTLHAELEKIEHMKRAEQLAKLATLSSIFPQLESELLEIVLITHHGVISKAIDSLLEMS